TEQVVAVLRRLDSEAEVTRRGPVLVFAGGSNLVIADTLGDLTAVRLANDAVTVDGNVVRAEGGRGGAAGGCPPSRTGWAGWSACRASPGRPAPPPCRTSGPTGRRCPTPSRGSAYWIAAAARCAGCRATSWASATAPACSSGRATKSLPWYWKSNS